MSLRKRMEVHGQTFHIHTITNAATVVILMKQMGKDKAAINASL